MLIQTKYLLFFVACFSIFMLDFVKSLTSNVKWYKHRFISRDNLHHTSRFHKVELGTTPNFKIVSKPLQRSIGPPAIGLSTIYIHAPKQSSPYNLEISTIRSPTIYIHTQRQSSSYMLVLYHWIMPNFQLWEIYRYFCSP
jgi:hypothetical protein